MANSKNINNHPTSPFTPIPSAMLIGVSPDQAAECTATLAPLVMNRVAHVLAACERMVTLRPLVVVLGSEQSDSDMTRLREIADTISAQVVVLSERLDAARRKLELTAALRAAQTTRKSY